MPELARFDGIIIRLYAEAGGQHHTAHFHAYYGEMRAVYAISPVGLMEGELPNTQHHKVMRWAAQHQRELQAAWDDLQAGRTIRKM